MHCSNLFLPICLFLYSDLSLSVLNGCVTLKLFNSFRLKTSQKSPNGFFLVPTPNRAILQLGLLTLPHLESVILDSDISSSKTFDVYIFQPVWGDTLQKRFECNVALASKYRQGQINSLSSTNNSRGEFGSPEVTVATQARAHYWAWCHIWLVDWEG